MFKSEIFDPLHLLLRLLLIQYLKILKNSVTYLFCLQQINKSTLIQQQNLVICRASKCIYICIIYSTLIGFVSEDVIQPEVKPRAISHPRTQNEGPMFRIYTYQCTIYMYNKQQVTIIAESESAILSYCQLKFCCKHSYSE